MVASGNSTYNDGASGFIDVFRYFSGSTVTSENYEYHCYYCKYENPRVPSKVYYNVKTRVQPFKLKPSRNIRHIKQFTGHSFRIGNSKK